jgi:hypothetical protein
VGVHPFTVGRAAQPHRKSWRELQRGQRVAIGAGVAVQLSLQAAALADLHRRSAQEVNGKKSTWVALSFINFVGPAAYFTLGRNT